MDRTTFAGWYTPKFCDALLDALQQDLTRPAQEVNPVGTHSLSNVRTYQKCTSCGEWLYTNRAGMANHRNHCVKRVAAKARKVAAPPPEDASAVPSAGSRQTGRVEKENNDRPADAVASGATVSGSNPTPPPDAVRRQPSCTGKDELEGIRRRYEQGH